jgi:exonuclease III
MKILIWNIRGLNKPLKQREIKKMVSRLNISIVCLVETRVKQDHVLKIRDDMLPGWEIFHNYNC